MSKVYFIGAGPGDPDLITVKGRKILEKADVIIYAGSLVNKEIINCRKKESEIYNSASMDLEEILSLIFHRVKAEKLVARVHTGDPSLYGAIREQIDPLEKMGIDCEVIPGVSSFVASAAVMNKEFTIPNSAQTVICTRLEGRTPVPSTESLELLASHRTSMAIFLSVHKIEEVVNKLLIHYEEQTPVAVIQKVTWEDQKIVTGTLKNISEKVKKAEIHKTAQILVGDFLGEIYETSKLYDKNFSHGYRSIKK
ncbi:precorrin-4 C(11)-methyltransferase [Garciella nitratireducens]|uniref:Cobalt-precorrin 4 C11-methyltransferase n=1 Tax=Garciella nitratireducens DSM 15102 TaxID=1121911 RepID=A0A1T4KIK2_9FIRM|nr:precorrin-4 C(11)-methyltransferase [Garciella nitratireducens]SJZ42230.1 cobalt-precorrin 4 C11-methyltransferase [Garciella nitratireducens DSM 15102]